MNDGNAQVGESTPAPATETPREATALDTLYGEAANPPAEPEPVLQPEAQSEAELAPEPKADDPDPADPAPEHDLPPVPAPSSWKAEEQEAFKALPRPLQETIQRRETQREQFVQQKAQEATRARQQLEAQARDEVMQIHAQAEQALERFVGTQEPRRPDPALLRGTEEDRADYYAQLGEFEAQSAQRREAQQQMARHRQQREAQEQHLSAQDRAEQAAILQQKFPEYLDPARMPDLSRELSAIGTALGYPPELMAEARAQDILALRQASDWKAKADKYDAIQREKMARVREAKQLTPVARPGNPGAAPKPQADPLAALYPNDIK